MVDRLRTTGWIILSALLAAACSGTGEDDGSSSQEATGRWTLPASTRAIGSHVSIPYENAPYWNGGANCTGKLREGSRALGADLMGIFPQVKSIGGYACRQNTADANRLSVHGTGKALDIFIPMQSGHANSDLGDPVADWLVEHASEIGIQLIIWNRSVWRANGSNEKPYTGPVPHIDHIHAELTEKAAKKLTPSFTEPHDGDAGAPPPTTQDAGQANTQTDAGVAHDAASVHEAGAHDAAAAGSDAAAAIDAAPPPPPDPPPQAEDDAGAAAPPTNGAPPENEYDPERDDDGEPGERDSIGMGIREVPEATDPKPEVNAGCATSSHSSRAPGSDAGLVAIGLAAVLVRRRRAG